jgi:protein TonB
LGPKKPSSTRKPKKPVSGKDRKPQKRLKSPVSEAEQRLPQASAPREKGTLALEETKGESESAASEPKESRLTGRAVPGSGYSGTEEGEPQTAPVCIHQPSPGYPHAARQNGWEGSVLVAALVDTAGIVRETRIVQGSGHAALDNAAGEAVKEWRFRPGEKSGRSVSMWVRIPITFQLK